MKWVLLKKGVLIDGKQVVDNIIEPANLDDVQYMAYLKDSFDGHIEADNNTYVGAGFTFDGESFYPPQEATE